jgi:hypothetical protein
MYLCQNTASIGKAALVGEKSLVHFDPICCQQENCYEVLSSQMALQMAVASACGFLCVLGSAHLFDTMRELPSGAHSTRCGAPCIL